MRDLLAEDEARSARVALAGGPREVRDKFSDLTNPAPWLLDSFGGASKSGATVSADTAFNVAVFSACLNVLGQSIAMLPCILKRKTAKGTEDAVDHPLYPLLKRKPSGVQNSYNWRSHKVVNTCLGGNGYSRIWRNPYSEIIAITPLKPVDVRPLVAGEGTADERMVYEWRGQKLHDFEVLHLRGLSSNGYTGRSVLQDLRETLGSSITAQDFTASTFRNGNRQPGILEGPATMTKEKADEFLKYLAANYAGATNAGKTRLTWGGVQWKTAGMTNQDAELLMSRRFEKEEILMWFRIAAELLGGANGTSTWGTGVDKLMRGFVTFTLQPWLVNLEQELEEKLLSEEEKAAGMFIKFNVDSLLRGDPLQRAQLFKTLREIRAITVNEIRATEDWDELPDTGANNAEWGFNTAGGDGRPAAPAGDPANDPANANAA